MAVGAHDLALVDLREDHRPRRCPGDEVGDVVDLVAKVVELEHDGIALSAVDARMLSEIFEDAKAKLESDALRACVNLSVVAVLVRRMPVAVTLPAARLSAVLCPIQSIEVLQRLHLHARAAPLLAHLYERREGL